MASRRLREAAAATLLCLFLIAGAAGRPAVVYGVARRSGLGGGSGSFYVPWKWRHWRGVMSRPTVFKRGGASATDDYGSYEGDDGGGAHIYYLPVYKRSPDLMSWWD